MLRKILISLCFLLGLFFTQGFQCEDNIVNLKVYPNPAKEEFVNIEITPTETEFENINDYAFKITIVDILGKEMFSEKTQISENKKIDISQNNSGAYIVSLDISNNGAVIMKKSTTLSIIK